MLQQFFDVFGKDNALVLFYEDLEGSPEVFLRRLEGFFGVGFDVMPSKMNVRLRSGGSRATQDVGVMTQLSRLKQRLFPELKLGVGKYLGFMDKLVVRRSVVIPSPEPWRETVTKRFRVANERFGHMVGRDLGEIGYL